MEIQIIGSTNNIKTKEEALELSRSFARLCYTSKDFDEILKEPDPTILIADLMRRGHHSVFDQPVFNFELKRIPKFGAMILNNERDYATSEKSARYTQMKVEGREKELYNKWMGIFQEEIKKNYPFLDEKQKDKTLKLAQENARYMTSVFTPTKMGHKLSFRQLNYIMHWFNDLQSEEPDTKFNVRVKAFMKEFNEKMDFLYEPGLDPKLKLRELSMFSRRQNFAEEFGENYSTSYDISFAGLAQAHRHRTLAYSMQPIKDNFNFTFFVPEIISEESLRKKWVADLESVSENYPQATLVDVHESGSYTDFISKMSERLCGNAQWEIMNSTRQTLEEYLINIPFSSHEVYSELEKYSHGPKCSFPHAKCTDPCPFRKELGIARKV